MIRALGLRAVFIAMACTVACSSWRAYNQWISPDGSIQVTVEHRHTGLADGRVRVVATHLRREFTLFDSGPRDFVVENAIARWSSDSRDVGLLLCNGFSMSSPILLGFTFETTPPSQSPRAIADLERWLMERTSRLRGQFLYEASFCQLLAEMNKR